MFVHMFVGFLIGASVVAFIVGLLHYLEPKKQSTTSVNALNLPASDDIRWERCGTGIISRLKLGGLTINESGDMQYDGIYLPINSTQSKEYCHNVITAYVQRKLKEEING